MLFAVEEGRPGEKSRLKPGARQRRHLQYKLLRRFASGLCTLSPRVPRDVYRAEPT
jgi:hypothetical protein